MLREPCNEGLRELLHLLIRYSEEFAHRIQQSLKNQRKGLVEADFRNLCSYVPEQFPYRAVICGCSLAYRKNHVPDTDDGQMAGQGVKGNSKWSAVRKVTTKK